MSNYERNNTMVACIVAVIAVGALAVVGFTYLGNLDFNWNLTPVHFSYDESVGSTTGTVALDVDIATGGVQVKFEDNATLLYRIDFVMENRSYVQYGEPTVAFADNVITLQHEVGGANITLGTGINYTITVELATGGIAVILSEGGVGNVSLTTGTGGIDLTILDDVTVVGNPTISLATTTGGVALVVDLPVGIGGSFDASTVTGGVNVLAPSWVEISSSHYETSDYETALQSVTITAHVTTGGIQATLT